MNEESALGFSFIRFGVDDIPNTTALIDQNGVVNYDRITTFSSADYAFLTSYAKSFQDGRLRVGGSAKVIYRSVGDMARAWGFGVDVGAQYNVGKWRFGAIGRDVTSTYNSWSFSLDEQTLTVFDTTGNDIPENGLEITLPRLVLGVGRQFSIKNKVFILAEANADITTDGRRNVLVSGEPFSIDPNLGLEISYLNIFHVRGGLGNFQRIKAEIGNYYEYTFQPNVGVGVRIKDVLSIDYALTDIGDQSVALYSNVFSLTVHINKQKK